MLAHALLALLLAAQAGQTDQTVPVKRGARLDVNNFSGDVIINVWNRDAVRVEVEHGDGDAVDIQATDQIV